MNAKHLFVLFTALVAPIVANLAYLVLVLTVGDSRAGEDRVENWLFINGFVVLPLIAAFACSALLFWRDRHFAQRKLPLQALGIAILAYAILPLLLLVWMPLIGLVYERMETGAMPDNFLRDAPTAAVYTSALLFIATALPAALLEMPVLHLVRKRLSKSSASKSSASNPESAAPPQAGASP